MNGGIMPNGEAAKKADRARRLRAKVEKRAKEENIPLAEALEKVLTEDGDFIGMSAEQGREVQTLMLRRTVGRGWGRHAFARRVEQIREQLAREHPKLSAAQIFLKAADLVAREDRQALAAYRGDAEEI
jgi:hypothetical protein